MLRQSGRQIQDRQDSDKDESAYLLDFSQLSLGYGSVIE